MLGWGSLNLFDTWYGVMEISNVRWGMAVVANAGQCCKKYLITETGCSFIHHACALGEYTAGKT